MVRGLAIVLVLAAGAALAQSDAVGGLFARGFDRALGVVMAVRASRSPYSNGAAPSDPSRPLYAPLKRAMR